MVSEGNLRFLREGGRRYIVGTAKGQLKRFEGELSAEGWQKIREGLEVKLCPGKEGEETFVLCRSAARGLKEKGMVERFEANIEAGLAKLVESCGKRKRKVSVIERRVGALLAANSRAKGLFKVEVSTGENGGAMVAWEKVESRMRAGPGPAWAVMCYEATSRSGMRRSFGRHTCS